MKALGKGQQYKLRLALHPGISVFLPFPELPPTHCTHWDVFAMGGDRFSAHQGTPSPHQHTALHVRNFIPKTAPGSQSWHMASQRCVFLPLRLLPLWNFPLGSSTVVQPSRETCKSAEVWVSLICWEKFLTCNFVFSHVSEQPLQKTQLLEQQVCMTLVYWSRFQDQLE